MASVSSHSLHEALDLARSRLAMLPESSSKDVLIEQAEGLRKELESSGSNEATEVIQRKIVLLHAVIAKSGTRRARSRRST